MNQQFQSRPIFQPNQPPYEDPANHHFRTDSVTSTVALSPPPLLGGAVSPPPAGQGLTPASSPVGLTPENSLGTLPTSLSHTSASVTSKGDLASPRGVRSGVEVLVSPKGSPFRAQAKARPSQEPRVSLGRVGGGSIRSGGGAEELGAISPSGGGGGGGGGGFFTKMRLRFGGRSSGGASDGGGVAVAALSSAVRPPRRIPGAGEGLSGDVAGAGSNRASDVPDPDLYSVAPDLHPPSTFGALSSGGFGVEAPTPQGWKLRHRHHRRVASEAPNRCEMVWNVA